MQKPNLNSKVLDALWPLVEKVDEASVGSNVAWRAAWKGLAPQIPVLFSYLDDDPDRLALLTGWLKSIIGELAEAVEQEAKGAAD